MSMLLPLNCIERFYLCDGKFAKTWEAMMHHFHKYAWTFEWRAQMKAQNKSILLTMFSNQFFATSQAG